ncbi:hypothetical protein [Couchioplanes caeruleus]|uniref:Lipoprotein with Yx(FWY)xxD motif n=2 Tax=Couchioplanes caeruleus TaxID=56438 RepID=A0A1K0GNC8_9ACTN|nr:hypothetical protein [Couchioplanes caeruleus]OJF12572.1 hypothetical protein BG844_20025 [Couchioplanes caeruleus subsp. caeruleus]ROP30601.1 secreted repeat protein with Y-X4-D motif [Couchioplanes caeruleus]
MKRTSLAAVAIAATGVFGLTACAQPTETAAVEVAAARSSTPPGADAPADPEGVAVPELAGAETPDPPTAPVPEPTVAKTQKWVKIYNGPSRKDVTPPASIRTGSKTVELAATPNAQIGTYVTDGAGRTLYRFDKDSNKPPKATCNGDCAKAWPPLLIKSPGKIFPQGLDPKILGYVERADGTCQVTINGWPVYYFAKDSKPGDILGQGVNGTWFAVNPQGGKTKPLPDAIQPAPEQGGEGGDAPADAGY